MSVDFQPGPVEATMRFKALEARRRLFGSQAPKRVEVVRHVLEPDPPNPVEQTQPEMSDLPFATPTVRSVILGVCAKHGVTRKELLSMSRHSRVMRCRQECCYALYNSGLMVNGKPISLPIVGLHLGRLHHTTVLHSIRVHAALLAANKNLKGTNEFVDYGSLATNRSPETLESKHG